MSLTYIDQVWAQAYAALQFANTSALSGYAELLQETMVNASDAIQASQLISSLQSQAGSIQQILALPINFGTVSACLNDRYNSLLSLVSGIQGLLPTSFSSASGLIIQGSPAVGGGDYISYYAAYSGELSPDYTYTGILENISQWQAVVSGLQSFYGGMPNTLLDTAQLISSGCLMVGQNIYSFSSGLTSGQLEWQYIYNQGYSLPATFFAANTLSNAMGTILGQQTIIASYALMSVASQLQNAIMIGETPQSTQQVQTTTVMGGETLQDVAARTTGNFENWEAIANLNGIVPGGLVSAGTQLFLPPVSPSGQTAVSYNINVLGRDIYLGPQNESMPAWNGDFQTIIGANNLIYALGRRLQTQLGTLFTHVDYGSRIPPEIGAVQTLQTATQIGAFGKSALLSDPRVSSVSNITLTSGNDFGTINFQATVVPIGPSQNGVQLNEILAP